jgi:putative endonuclease
MTGKYAAESKIATELIKIINFVEFAIGLVLKRTRFSKYTKKIFMKTNNDLGNAGEHIAAEFLTKKGYSVIAQNWRSGHLELDIIAQIGKTIVFAEVKTRSGTYFQQPFQAVNYTKQKLIIQAANAYINRYEIDFETRFDILSIVKTVNGYDVEHIEDAFYPKVR